MILMVSNRSNTFCSRFRTCTGFSYSNEFFTTRSKFNSTFLLLELRLTGLKAPGLNAFQPRVHGSDTPTQEVRETLLRSSPPPNKPISIMETPALLCVFPISILHILQRGS